LGARATPSVTIRERSLRRFMLITPEKVGVQRLYCAVRSDGEAKLPIWSSWGAYILHCNIKSESIQWSSPKALALKLIASYSPLL